MTNTLTPDRQTGINVTTRRKFMKLCSMSLAALLFPVGGLRAKSKRVAFALEKVTKLKKVGGWAVLKIKDRHILFVRDTETTIKALDSVCTHKECTVEYDPEINKIECPCHGSKYDLDGSVVTPPAKKPLKAFDARLSDGRVILALDEDD